MYVCVCVCEKREKEKQRREYKRPTTPSKMADCIGNTGAFYLATRRAYCNNFWAYSIANGATYGKRHFWLAALCFLALHPLLLTHSLSPSLSDILLCNIHENSIIVSLLTGTESKHNGDKVGHCTESTQTQHGLLFRRQLGLLHKMSHR